MQLRTRYEVKRRGMFKSFLDLTHAGHIFFVVQFQLQWGLRIRDSSFLTKKGFNKRIFAIPLFEIFRSLLEKEIFRHKRNKSDTQHNFFDIKPIMYKTLSCLVRFSVKKQLNFQTPFFVSGFPITSRAIDPAEFENGHENSLEASQKRRPHP